MSFWDSYCARECCNVLLLLKIDNHETNLCINALIYILILIQYRKIWKVASNNYIDLMLLSPRYAIKQLFHM